MRNQRIQQFSKGIIAEDFSTSGRENSKVEIKGVDSEGSAREGDGWDVLGCCVTGISIDCFRRGAAGEGDRESERDEFE